ncbi:MAG: hypothetical protein ABIX37_11005 [Gammaproteobacteria bacterium]
MSDSRATVPAQAVGLFLALLLALPAGRFAAAESAAPSASVQPLSVQKEFDEAMASVEQARLRTAREQLTRLLAANPSLSRARLELARVYYLSRDYAAARTEAQRVLDDPNTPPSVKATVLAFLAQIDADEKRFAARHQWSPSFYAGVLYDTNVNVGPSRDIIDIGGLPFQVAAESRETSDWAGVINTGITHTYNPNRRFDWGEDTGTFVWQSEANAYYRAYFDESDFNLGVLTLRTGPAWIVPGHWRAYVGLQGEEIFLGGDDLAFFGSVNPGIAWQIGNDWEVGLDAIVTDRNYHNDADSGRDGLYVAPYLTVGRYFRQRSLLVQVGAGYPDFDADRDYYSYNGPDVFIGFTTEAWQNGAVFGRLGYRWYNFDGVEPLFGFARDDDELRATLGFQHDFREGALANWSLVGGWTYTDNQSSVPLYEYDRHQVGLGLSRRF